MSRSSWSVLSVAVALIFASTLSAQPTPVDAETRGSQMNPSPTPHPLGSDVSPTSSIPSSALTPGGAMRKTPSSGYGSTMSSTPSTDYGSSGMGASNNPKMASDCANEGWKTYSNPKFKSRRSCEVWVRRHHRMSQTPASGGSTRTTTPPAPQR